MPEGGYMLLPNLACEKCAEEREDSQSSCSIRVSRPLDTSSAWRHNGYIAPRSNDGANRAFLADQHLKLPVRKAFGGQVHISGDGVRCATAIIPRGSLACWMGYGCHLHFFGSIYLDWITSFPCPRRPRCKNCVGHSGEGEGEDFDSQGCEEFYALCREEPDCSACLDTEENEDDEDDSCSEVYQSCSDLVDNICCDVGDSCGANTRLVAYIGTWWVGAVRSLARRHH